MSWNGNGVYCTVVQWTKSAYIYFRQNIVLKVYITGDYHFWYVLCNNWVDCADTRKLYRSNVVHIYCYLHTCENCISVSRCHEKCVRKICPKQNLCLWTWYGIHSAVFNNDLKYFFYHAISIELKTFLLLFEYCFKK